MEWTSIHSSLDIDYEGIGRAIRSPPKLHRHIVTLQKNRARSLDGLRLVLRILGCVQCGPVPIQPHNAEMLIHLYSVQLHSGAEDVAEHYSLFPFLTFNLLNGFRRDFLAMTL